MPRPKAPAAVHFPNPDVPVPTYAEVVYQTDTTWCLPHGKSPKHGLKPVFLVTRYATVTCKRCLKISGAD